MTNPEQNEQDQPKPAEPSGASLAKLVGFCKDKVTLTVSGAIALVAIATGAVTNLETLTSKYWGWQADRAFEQTIVRPFPDPLKPEDVADWTSGRLELALLQIDGYLGRLKSGPSWVKLCLINPFAFPYNADKQFNDRIELTESAIDRENRLFLRRQIDQIEKERKEESDILRINDPFDKLLKRSESQLLSKYKGTEIARLEKSELYLLRNAIYGRQGRPFETAKLAKYANRNGWSERAATFDFGRLKPLDICNAFFLEELHPERELGALGRGVLIREPNSPLFPRFLTSSLCTCLAQPKFHIECTRTANNDNRTEYSRNVDLIIEFGEGQANRVDWTFINPNVVIPTDKDVFERNREKLDASALDFNAAVQTTLRARNMQFSLSEAHKRDAFWGVRVSFAPDTLRALSRDPAFSQDVSAKMCLAVHSSLERAGPYLPRTVDLVGSSPGLSPEGPRIYQKPIEFGDQRIKLTMDYVQKYYGVSIAQINYWPWMIVLHRSKDDLETTFRAMQPATLKQAGGAADVNMSVHYLIDRDGTVYSLMNDFYIARHVPGRNRFAIGIVNVGGDEASLTESQVEANAKLVRYLKKKYWRIDYLIANSESSAFGTSKLWEEKGSPDQPLFADPGAIHMKKVRELVAALGLKSTPE